MKLKDCKYGILVTDKKGMIGMVVGVTNVYPNQGQSIRGLPENAMPLVEWQCGAKYGIHPSNIELLK